MYKILLTGVFIGIIGLMAYAFFFPPQASIGSKPQADKNAWYRSHYTGPTVGVDSHNSGRVSTSRSINPGIPAQIQVARVISTGSDNTPPAKTRLSQPSVKSPSASSSSDQ